MGFLRFPIQSGSASRVSAGTCAAPGMMITFAEAHDFDGKTVIHNEASLS